MRCLWRQDLQIFSKSIEFGDEEVDVFVLSSWIGDDVSEEVGNVSLRLVADHQGSCIHHSSLQDRSDLRVELFWFVIVGQSGFKI